MVRQAKKQTLKVERDSLQAEVGTQVLDHLDRRDETPARLLVLPRQPVLVSASKAVLPLGRLRAVEAEWLCIRIARPRLVDDREDLKFDAEVHLDAHALGIVAYLASVSAVVKQWF